MEAIALSTKFLAMGDQSNSVKLFEPNPVQGEPEKLNTQKAQAIQKPG